MSCSKPKCRVKGDEQMVACWLCNDIYHAKCVDLAARTADNLREDKGLRWCCKKCIIYDVEFFSFFKNTNAELDGIINDLNRLTLKCSKYKELFDKASCSPKRKKTGTEANTALHTNNPSYTGDNIVDTVQMSSLHPSTSSVSESQISSQPQLQASLRQMSSFSSDSLPYSSVLRLTSLGNPQCNQLMSPTINAPQNYPHVPSPNNFIPVTETSNNPASNAIIHPNSTSSVPPETNLASTSSNTIPATISSASLHFNPTSNSSAPIHSNFTPTHLTSNSSAPIHSNFTPTHLTVIPPRKSIFISRLAFNTTVDDIFNYIKFKLNSIPDVFVKKFEYSEPRTVTSFKLVVPFDLYSKIIDPDFWPANIFVREYKVNTNSRSTNIVNLPITSIADPKN